MDAHGSRMTRTLPSSLEIENVHAAVIIFDAYSKISKGRKFVEK